VQLAKGAIAAGIELMTTHLGVTLQDIQTVYLAGAFGTFMTPASACRIGLLPSALETKIKAVGNAAGSGAKILACNEQALPLAQELVTQVEFIELASLPDFQRCFANKMRFCDMESYWCQKAISLGFSKAAPLDISTLQARQDVRNMCAADKCRAYNKNWTCPPHCGTLAECNDKMHSYTHGILLQTVGITEKTIDTKAYRRTEAQHLEQFHTFCALIRNVCPEALCLGSGGCRICAECAFPEVCRFPEKACSSMEGYGLFVTQVCQDNNLSYNYGERTVTYTACVLFNR
jgi:predicted metal-binding protein